MVVLELEGHTNMLGSGPNEYLRPDYFPSPLESKAGPSPLALLAQTCSQIGSSDGPSSKNIFETSKRKLSTCSESSLKSESSSDSIKDPGNVINNKDQNGTLSESNHANDNNNRPKSGSSSVSPLTKSSGGGKSSPVLINTKTASPAFKPYDITHSKSSHFKDSGSNNEKSYEKHSSAKTSKNSSLSRHSSNVSPKVKSPNSRSTPENVVPPAKESSGSGSSTKVASGSHSSSLNTSGQEGNKSVSGSDHGASPIIRSGLEVLQQGQFGSPSAIAEYNRKLSALSSLSAFGAGYPSGFDPLHPAFRSSFLPPNHPHHGMGYPHIPGANSPYVSYSRVKTASGETIVPVCKDPLCSGCMYGGGGVPHGSLGPSTSTMNGLMAAASGFSGGTPSSGVNSGGSSDLSLQLFPPSSGYSQSLLSQQAIAASQQNAQRPYVCNWIVGENYCGKRYPSSEELLQHLRSHTNSATANSTSGPGTDSAVLAALVQQQNQLAALSTSPSSSLYSNPLLNPVLAAMHRTYPTPPLSPLSAARFHPYAVAGKIPPPMPPSSSSMAAALSNYYAAAALYGQRVGPSVHP